MNIKRFTSEEEQLFYRRCSLSEEISQLRKRMELLDKDRKTIDELLVFSFKDVDACKTSKNTLVTLKITPVKPIIVTPEMVGQVIREGYNRLTFKEIAGEFR